jgi:hypothetical protein
MLIVGSAFISFSMLPIEQAFLEILGWRSEGTMLPLKRATFLK